MKPVVSIITPYKNAQVFLARFVASIKAQTRTDWICIMVDDGSTDNGPYLLSQIVSGDSRFILLKNTSKKTWPGPASARNFALDTVATPLIAFCDVDDLWHPTKLELQLAFHLESKLDLSVTAYARFFNDRPDTPLNVYVCPPCHLSLSKLGGRNPIPMLTVIMDADLARAGFLQVPHEDFLFWLELFRSKPLIRYGCLPIVLAYYCIHENNLSAQKAIMPFWTYRVFRQFGESRVSSSFHLLSWTIDHLASKILER